MSSLFDWTVVFAGGLIAGVLGPRVWKVALAFGALAIFFVAVSIAWGNARGLPPATVLALDGGQVTQLVVVAYVCAVASVIMAARIAMRGRNAT